MKFDVGDIDQYEGEDLIFLIGTPGSRWSSVHRIICESPSINNTDWSEEKSWTFMSEDVHGDIRATGGHFGSYWGPGNMYGQNFGRLDSLSKEQILKEFMDAYENWDKVKVIKSHWFAYNIPFITNMFPKAKLVSCYANDIDCFFWWHKSGGWGLGYANYAWYENDMRMLEQIKQENSHILKFSIDRDLDFKIIKRSELLTKLNLEVPNTTGDPNLKVKVTVYNNDYTTNFSHLTSSDIYLMRTKGTK